MRQTVASATALHLLAGGVIAHRLHPVANVEADHILLIVTVDGGVWPLHVAAPAREIIGIFREAHGCSQNPQCVPSALGTTPMSTSAEKRSFGMEDLRCADESPTTSSPSKLVAASVSSFNSTKAVPGLGILTVIPVPDVAVRLMAPRDVLELRRVQPHTPL